MDPSLIQGTAEWLELRKGYIGASDSPIIMEVSPYSDVESLLQEKLGLTQRPDHPGMAYGRKMEPVAREAYEHENLIVLKPKVIFHPEHKFMMASLDGFNQDQGKAIEIKCANAKDTKTAQLGELPEKYYPQCQHQLAILYALYGIDEMIYWSFHKNEGTEVIVKYDEDYVKELIFREEAFFQRLTSLKAEQNLKSNLF